MARGSFLVRNELGILMLLWGVGRPWPGGPQHVTVALSVGIWLSIVHAPAGRRLSIDGQLGRPWGGAESHW